MTTSTAQASIRFTTAIRPEDGWFYWEVIEMPSRYVVGAGWERSRRSAVKTAGFQKSKSMSEAAAQAQAPAPAPAHQPEHDCAAACRAG